MVKKEQARGELWWLKKDCRECADYPNCDFIETGSAKPRGCSHWHEPTPQSQEGLQELQRFLADILNGAWRKGRDGQGIDLTEEAVKAIEFSRRLGYSSPQEVKEQVKQARREEREKAKKLFRILENTRGIIDYEKLEEIWHKEDTRRQKRIDAMSPSIDRKGYGKISE